eukprot:NODE_2577_length_1164_cov_39.521076_g2356_i0.p1 GENE.NODE_2577_length_1164_cov_39.521076_g2356_i0~~NODE_2577_length_1164_cov_39.521076_g2356_i0.p1  ORF type:complete len:311 (+),score=87.83 NODE_2577_length_1164_cov_39.521076_g2356_i0:70-1002(+)
MALWLEETLEAGLRFSYRLKKVMHSAQSKFQHVQVVETEPFGKALIIDGLIQSSDLDERIYHECLVHPAMLIHKNPRTVFLGGAGEGSTAREVLKHKTVEKCVMVDIDEDVVHFCKENLMQNKEAFADPRLELIIDDAKKQLEESAIKFDVIIMDLDDPLDGGPCYTLYTKSFYEMCKTKLNPGGVLVTQTSAAGVKTHKLVFTPVNNTLKAVFPKVLPYLQAVYSFGDEWSYNLALSDDTTEFPSMEEVNKRIAERGLGDLFFLDGESFHRIFLLSKQVREALKAETRVLTEDAPAFFGKLPVDGEHQK